MKDYQLVSEFLLRTPSLSCNSLFENLSKMDNKENTIVALKGIYQDKRIQESLFLGSPNLYRLGQGWLNGEIDSPADVYDIVRTLLHYYLRMSTRCTPFGTFAGCSVGTWDSVTNVRLQPWENASRNTRLDMHYLCALVQNLEGNKSLRSFLDYYPNSSCYHFGDTIRYVEYYYQNNERHHQISSVRFSKYLRRILVRAQGGASFNELVRSLTEEGVNQEHAQDYLNELIDSQLLVSELEPSITGGDLLEQIINTLERIKNQQLTPSVFLKKSIRNLKDVKNHLMYLDRKEGQVPGSVYSKIIEKLICLNASFDESKLFQVDMYKKSQTNLLNLNIAAQIRKGLDVINRLTVKRSSGPSLNLSSKAQDNLKLFRKTFFERYGTSRVSLLKTLDNESGIGYLQSHAPGDTHPVIDDIQSNTGVVNSEFQLEPKSKFLLRKLLQSIENGNYSIELQDDEVQDFAPYWSDVPDTISVLGSILGASKQTSEQIYIRGAGGSSATYLLGRFTPLSDEINSMAREISTYEQELHPNLIFAEIVHLPEARVGNILLRTQLRPYEIPFLARSSVPKENQIELKDLFLQAVEGRLVLTSERFDKEIIPRLSTAHNFSQSDLPVYQFLCDLQFQGLPGSPSYDNKLVPYLRFTWGPIQNEFRFLPRVTYQNIILQRAQWQLNKKDYEELLGAAKSNLLEVIEAYRSLWKLPRYIVIADSDNELFIDMENYACLDLLVSEMKKNPRILLKEFLFDPENAIVQDTNGERYTNEFIMAFARKAIEKEERPKPRPIKITEIPRSFPMGSEWLYYKIYAGALSSDELLVDKVPPLVGHLLEQNLIDHWFFIRYGDPNLHLRIRLHLTDTSQIGQVIQQITAQFQTPFQQRKIWKIQTDTYEREVERYGRNTMELSEQLFFQDSQSIVQFLAECPDYEDPELLRWYFAMMSIDHLLNGFELDLKSKTELLQRLKTGFAAEFNMNQKAGTKQLSKKYREHREMIEKIAQGQLVDFSEEILDILQNKAIAIQPICDSILSIQGNGDLEVPFFDFLGSHIHMLMNRLFRSQQRKYEMVIYDMLYRAYKSVLARTKLRQASNEKTK